MKQRLEVRGQKLEKTTITSLSQVPVFGCNERNIEHAARIIADGGVGAFPTETVYGLGGDAANPVAVARIYEAKGRPGDNPLIVHIADLADFCKIAGDAPAYAYALMDAFWPGPLTLVAQKKEGLPSWLGGHPKGTADTIGIRMPSHPMALAMIRESGCFIAAPSANKAGTPSPTRACHVATDFSDGSIDFILDGGAVPGGLESTVVDVTGVAPVILRPGTITPEMIAEVTGLEINIGQSRNDGEPLPLSDSAPRSPGMKYRHYAPKAPMTLIIGSECDIAAYIVTQGDEMHNRKVGILVTSQTKAQLDACNFKKDSANILILGDKAIPESIARNLYACLRQFDVIGVDIIFAEGPSQKGLGLAIMDRMKKAAEGRVIHVS